MKYFFLLLIEDLQYDLNAVITLWSAEKYVKILLMQGNIQILSVFISITLAKKVVSFVFLWKYETLKYLFLDTIIGQISSEILSLFLFYWSFIFLIVFFLSVFLIEWKIVFGIHLGLYNQFRWLCTSAVVNLLLIFLIRIFFCIQFYPSIH